MKIKKSKTVVLVSMTPLEFSKMRQAICTLKVDLPETSISYDLYDNIKVFCSKFEEADKAPVRALREPKRKKRKGKK